MSHIDIFWMLLDHAYWMAWGGLGLLCILAAGKMDDPPAYG